MSAFERQESPLFVKTRDFIVWLLRQTAKFPRQYRQTLTARLEQSALEFQRNLGRCQIARQPEALQAADVELWQMRQLLRIAHDLEILPARLLEHAFIATSELGRLLGGWRAKVAETATSDSARGARGFVQQSTR
jgi:hypothetical protein